jgi:hypothetical protein
MPGGKARQSAWEASVGPGRQDRQRPNASVRKHPPSAPYRRRRTGAAMHQRVPCVSGLGRRKLGHRVRAWASEMDGKQTSPRSARPVLAVGQRVRVTGNQGGRATYPPLEGWRSGGGTGDRRGRHRPLPRWDATTRSVNIASRRQGGGLRICVAMPGRPGEDGRLPARDRAAGTGAGGPASVPGRSPVAPLGARHSRPSREGPERPRGSARARPGPHGTRSAA